MSRSLGLGGATSLAIALVAIGSGCDPLHPQPFFAAPWNEEDACLDKTAAVDVYDDESEPKCTAPASCVEGPEDDERLYVTECPIPEGWRKIDAASEARCSDALEAFAAGKDGRCS